MKITILFLTFLIFISCSTKLDGITDSVFLELSRDERTNAVFALMSMQLKQDDGFQRVLALLNGLVDDVKKQFKETSKVYAGVDVRCTVSDMKFNERNDFLRHKLDRFTQAHFQAVEERSSFQDNLSVFQSRLNTFNDYLNQEKARHDDEMGYIQSLINDLNTGLDRVNEAIAAVQKWRTSSLNSDEVQSKLDSVSDSYLQTHQVRISIPPTLIQLAQSDDQIKDRILDWLSTLIGELHLTIEQWNKVKDDRTCEYNGIKSDVNDLLKQLTIDVDWLQDTIAVAQRIENTSENEIEFVSELLKNNEALIENNNRYCNTERANFEKGVQDLSNSVKLFKDLREYFRDNYTRLSKWLLDQYHLD